jgi:transposase-like protein
MRQRHNAEFKRSAVALVKEQQQSIRQAAANLGIGAGTLRYWIRKDRQRQGSDSEAESLRIQLVEAQRQIHRLTEEREILKKATAYFAKESL